MPIELPSDYADYQAEVLADQDREPQAVYETWWTANSRYPQLALSTRLAIAESVVRDMLEQGRIKLVRGLWVGYEFPHEEVTDLRSLSWPGTPGSPNPTSQRCGWLTSNRPLASFRRPGRQDHGERSCQELPHGQR
jgi:hypothetical protein